ncbi:glycosyl hydrolase [Bacteroidota bacterium]
MIRFVILFTFLCSLLNCQSVSSQTNVKVNGYRSLYEPEETTIFINPLNTDNFIGGANTDIFYYTFDRGKTWKEGKLPGPVVYGDPVVCFDMLGNGYYVHLGPFTNTGIFISKTTDGGIKWSNSKRIFGNESGKPFMDKPWIGSDRNSNSEYYNNLYVCWTEFDKYHSYNPKDSSRILFSKSTDNGNTFSKPIKISDLCGDSRDGDSTVEGAVPTVGPDGQIYVAWSGPRGIEFTSSYDGGLSFTNNVFVTDQVNGWAYDIPGLYRCNGLPFTDCDISSNEYKGTIYINFSDNRNGDYDVFIVKSTDEGETWSSLIRVNDDQTGNGKDQFMNHFCVDPITGVINVLFYDRRNYDDKKTDVILARSTDGGTTFTNHKVSDSPFIPDKEIFFGDYIGVNSYNDLVTCLWPRMDNKILSVRNYTNQF